jgi:CRISPR type IV-associated protein Csf2
MKTIHFQGFITTINPYTSSTQANSKVAKGSPKKVARMQLGADSVLCMLSSNIKGAIRRACEEFVYDEAKKLTGLDKPFSLHDSYTARVGGIKGGGAEAHLTPTDFLDIRKKNAFYSLFGGNEPFMDGHIVVEEARAPVGVRPDVIDGVRKDDFRSQPELVTRLSDEEVESYLERQGITKDISAAKAEERHLLVELRNAADEKTIKALEKKLEKVKEKLKANNVVSTQMPLDGFEAIPAGLQLSHVMRIRTGNDVETALLIKGLERFAFNPYLGGKIANGFGQVGMQYTVYSTCPSEGRKELGSIELIPFEGIKLSGELKSFLSKWDEYVDQGSDVVDFRKPL